MNMVYEKAKTNCVEQQVRFVTFASDTVDSFKIIYYFILFIFLFFHCHYQGVRFPIKPLLVIGIKVVIEIVGSFLLTLDISIHCISFFFFYLWRQ